jgi:hypothetical protein
VTLASKENPAKDSIKEALVWKPPKKATAEAKTKRQKRQTSHAELSLEQHQTPPSLSDISSLLSFLNCTMVVVLRLLCHGPTSYAKICGTWLGMPGVQSCCRSITG